MDYPKKNGDNLEEGSLDDLLSAIRHIVSTPPSAHPEDAHPEIIDLKRPLPNLEPELDLTAHLSSKVQDDVRQSFQVFSQGIQEAQEVQSQDAQESMSLKDVAVVALKQFFQDQMKSWTQRQVQIFLDSWLAEQDDSLKSFMHKAILQWLETHMSTLVRTMVKEHLDSLSRSRQERSNWG